MPRRFSLNTELTLGVNAHTFRPISVFIMPDEFYIKIYAHTQTIDCYSGACLSQLFVILLDPPSGQKV
jgi:hypothetical protein